MKVIILLLGALAPFASPASKPESGDGCGDSFSAASGSTVRDENFAALVGKLGPELPLQALFQVGLEALFQDPEKLIAASSLLADRERSLVRSISQVSDPNYPTLVALREIRTRLGDFATDPAQQDKLTGKHLFDLLNNLGVRLDSPTGRLGLDPSKFTTATRERLQREIASELVSSGAPIPPSALAVLQNPGHSDYSQTLLHSAETIYRAKLQSPGSHKPWERVQEKLLALFAIDSNPTFWNRGRVARLHGATFRFDTNHMELLSPSLQLPHSDQKHGYPSETGILNLWKHAEHLTHSHVTEEQARELADGLSAKLEATGLDLAAILDVPTFTLREDTLMREKLKPLLDGKLVTAMKVDLNEANGLAKSKRNLSGQKSIIEQIFFLNRPYFESGELRIIALDPSTLTVDGKPLTFAQRREVWRYNALMAMEEHLHVVQTFRACSGLSDTQENVSRWARSLRGAPVDHEADVYAYLHEIFGPLPPILGTVYGVRRSVPVGSLVRVSR